MGGTFNGIDIARTSLIAHKTAMDITGHNIANANSEGYSRQRVTLQSNQYINSPNSTGPVTGAQLGTGVQIEEVQRFADTFLNSRVREENEQLGQYEKEHDFLRQIEMTLNPTGQENIRSQLDKFFETWQNMSTMPEDIPTRALVRSEAVTLSEDIRDVYNKLQDLQQNADDLIRMKVDDVNKYAAEIADLTDKINTAMGAGEQPNDLLDRRDLLIEKLSKLGNVQVTENDFENYKVIFGGGVIAQGTQHFPLTIQNNSDALAEVYLKDKQAKAMISTGEIGGLLTVRDTYIKDKMDDLNEFTVSFVNEVNSLHKLGYDLNGKTGVNFFETLPTNAGETSIYKVEAAKTTPTTMASSSSSNYRYVMESDVALDGDSSTSGFENYEQNPIGIGKLTINSFTVSYNASTDSMNDIIDRINSANGGVRAYLNDANRLVMAAERSVGYKIDHLSDSGNLLNFLGVMNGTYNGTQSTEGAITGSITRKPVNDVAGRIKVDSQILTDLNRIAAAKGEDTGQDDWPDQSVGVGDGTNAMDIADLRFKKIFAGNTQSFGDYYDTMVTETAVLTQTAENNRDATDEVMNFLDNERESYRGVSLDEEFTNLIKYQQGFNAAARVIRSQSEMLDILMSLGL